jgi:ribosomal protein S27AE
MGVSKYLWTDLRKEGFQMPDNKKMICPNCGAEMNHHCDKLMYGMNTQQEAQTDPGLGGMVQEFHTCPKCGNSGSRPLSTGDQEW